MIGQAPITEITPIWREIQIKLRIQYATPCATTLAKVPSNESCYAPCDDALRWNATRSYAILSFLSFFLRVSINNQRVLRLCHKYQRCIVFYYFMFLDSSKRANNELHDFGHIQQSHIHTTTIAKFGIQRSEQKANE